MSLVFGNAPLVEMNVQVQWVPSMTITVPPQSMATFSFSGDDFYNEFAEVVSHEGFIKSERVIPPGVVAAPYQVVYRYRHMSLPVLYQIGAGIFAVNATPPYKTWNHFKPYVRSGLKALLATRPDVQKDQPFTSIQVRYINIFGASLLFGMPPATFLANKLGFTLPLPRPIASRTASKGVVTSMLIRATAPIGPSSNLVVSVGDTYANNTPAAVLDLLGETQRHTAGDVERAIAEMETIHDVIHGAFIDLVEPIWASLDPKEVEDV